jgi:hypothetical protein
MNRLSLSVTAPLRLVRQWAVASRPKSATRAPASGNISRRSASGTAKLMSDSEDAE